MSCQRCKSDRLLKLCGKTADKCSAEFGGKEQFDYPPRIPDIADGCDYIETTICH